MIPPLKNRVIKYMSFKKKICLYTIIILLIMSLYNDIRKGYNYQKRSLSKEPKISVTNENPTVKVKIQPGDTILSVSERINGDHLQHIKMEDVMKDFQKVNPDVKELRPNTYYLFPIY